MLLLLLLIVLLAVVLILKYILQYYSYLLYFDQINAVLLSSVSYDS